MKRQQRVVSSAVERGIPAPVAEILIDHLAIDEDELTLDSKLCDDLGADELDLVELQIAFERRYRVSAEDDWLDDERWPHMTVAQLIADLKRLGARIA